MGVIKVYEEFINSDLITKFYHLKDMWDKDTYVESDPNVKHNNENYREIISLGKEIIPILIKDLDTSNGDWFNALRNITGVDPVIEENRGYHQKMVDDWKKWYNKNYV